MRKCNKAIVRGTYHNKYGMEENVTLEFELIPPKKGEMHYGTGYYMTVEVDSEINLYDIRYEKTTEIDELINITMKNRYSRIFDYTIYFIYNTDEVN